MEFRVIIGGDYCIPDNGHLILYLQGQDTHLIMHYNER